MRDCYDVIIVGAGPAGGTAAFYLGQAGKQVLVIEKEHLPRYKTCGGGVPATLLSSFPFSFEPVIESRVKSISYAFKSHLVTMPVQEDQIRMVMRDDFDSWIVTHTQAEICQGIVVRKIIEKEDRVIVETNKGEIFQCRHLIGADGANSIVARSLNLRRGRVLGAAIEVEAQVPPEVMQRFADQALFIFGEVRLGYAWIFPKASHLSVGIGALHPKPGELQSKLKKIMAPYGIDVEGIPYHGHPIPIYTGRQQITTDRCLLVGDAAGLVDPFSGEGIRFAIKSGGMAAEAILSGEIGKYPVRVFREIGFSHSFGIVLALLFYYLPNLCFAFGVRNPFATGVFVDLLSDRANYLEVILGIFGTLPIFLLTEAVAALAGLLGGPDKKEEVRSAVYSRGGAYRLDAPPQ
jgi:geranylgeranyl reductase family protein